MVQKDLNELITTYVDGEITDPSTVNEIKNLIEKDRSIELDYNVQSLMKSIISDKLKILPTPENIRKKVIRKIKPSKNFLISFISEILF